MQKSMMRFGVVLIFVGIIIAIHVSGLSDCFTFETIKSNRQFFVQYVSQHYYWAVLWYMFSYIAAVVFFLPAASLMTIIGGFLFGIRSAASYAICAATLGAVISFLLIRYLIGSIIQKRYAEQLHTFNHAMQQNGTFYLLRVRFIPLIPFAIINVLAGLTRISVWNFIWTTAVGIVPTTLVFTFAGRQLAAVSCAADLVSVPMLLALGCIMCLALLSFLFESRV